MSDQTLLNKELTGWKGISSMFRNLFHSLSLITTSGVRHHQTDQPVMYSRSKTGTAGFTLITILVFSFLSVSVRAQIPVIRNVQPINGYPGQVINIQGENLTGATEIRFGGVLGNVISRSDQLIEVEVPIGATFEYISVINTANHLGSRSKIPYAMSFGGTPGLTPADFDSEEKLSARAGLLDICMCDLNGDGKNDLVAANSNDNSASLFLNNSTPGNLSFTTSPIVLGAPTSSVTCGDLNGDRLPELIFSENADGQRLFILNNTTTLPAGMPSFSSANIIVTDNATNRSEIHDLDGDGKPEIVISDSASPKVSIIKNNSSGGNLSWASTPININLPTGSDNAASIQIADLNNDERADIIVNQVRTTNGDIFVSLNQSSPGNINFAPFSPLNVSGTPIIIKIADLNRDQKPDLVFTQSLENSLSILINQTASGSRVTFAAPIVMNTDSRPFGLDIADFDGDGLEDLIVGTSDIFRVPKSVNVLRNTSSGSTVSFSTISIGVEVANQNVRAGDLDNDGRPDIAFNRTDNIVSILRNTKCLVPVIDPDETVNICSGNTKRLNTQKLNGATYQWEINNIAAGTNDPFIDITVSSGDYTVTISDATGCSETSSPVSVTVGASPIGYVSPNFTSPTAPVCIGDSVIFKMNSGAYSYEWRGPNNFTSTGQQVTVSDFRFINSGVYEVDVIDGGCTVETLNLTVETLPSPEFNIVPSATTPICENQTVMLTVSPNATGFTFDWFDSNDTPVQPNSSSFTPTVSGAYRVRATDTSNPTCPSIDSAPQRVDILTLPQANFDSPASSCVNSVITFQNTSVVDAAGTARYQWDFGDGKVSTQADPVHAYVAQGSYTVTLTVSYEGVTCEDTETASITIQPGIDVQLTAQPEAICEGEASEITTTESFQTFEWNSGESTSSLSVNAPGTYSVTVTNASGCSGSGQITINAFPQPIVEVTSDVTNVAPGEPVQLNASGLVTYSWSPAELLDDPTIANPIAALEVPTLFEVIGEDINGCPGSGSIQILTEGDLIGELLDPKNFFSPNTEDNINATWTIDRILDFPQCEVTIYDQTGNVLFKAQPYLNDWDGTSLGQQLPTGVYYFTINCGGDELAKAGSITLLR
ncbi:T9SS type B sorting domain-containing protein [Fulvivirga sp. M361]|uniref:FG-GAP-like repeat-containing protein n=1 Tax=Fulvivirga sp. M361 TaxID=2594266 RepID=UPI00117B7662|nr:FG-GAP-like repeat-containing protein [Fulvivirga sp. M361]TRX51399.1 T9SS type B sorting domain-containing protein [Fulvivirga sp. M361]